MRRAGLLFVVLVAALLGSVAPALAASGTPEVMTGAASPVGTTTATLNGSVNLNGASLSSTGDLTDPGQDCYFEYGTTTSYGSTVPCASAPGASGTSSVTASISNLTSGTTYHYQLVVVYAGLLSLVPTDADGGDATFIAGAPVTATLGTPTNVYSTTAELKGTVNPGGQTVKACSFNYGTSASALSGSVSCSPTPSGSTDAGVSGTAAGLTASTTYYYNLAVTTASGTVTTATGSFATTSSPPPAPTGVNPPTVTSLGNISATLSGTVNPNSVGVVSCSFAYGTGTPYSSTVPCSAYPPDTGGPVTAPISGLSQGTLYHFQLTLVTGGGTFTSQDATFTTLDAETQAATDITATTATVNAQVNPEGQSVTGCLFLYAVEPYGQAASVPCTQSQISGTSPVSVSAPLSGLTPSSTYVYAVELQTSTGQAIGNVTSLVTPAAPKKPTATTGAVTGLTSSSVTLHATVNGGGSASQGCQFEYGVQSFSSDLSGSATTYGIDTGCSPSPGSDSTNVSAVLHGLAPNTTYYYRILFATKVGYVVGATRSFHTPIGKSYGKPGTKITRATIKAVNGSAVFRFGATRVGATQAQCSLVAVSGGRTPKPRYTTCHSPKTYKGLKAGTYVFSVRLGNSAGFGRAVSRRFSI